MPRLLIGLSLATQLILGVHDPARAGSPESSKLTGSVHVPNGRASDLILGVARVPTREVETISGGDDARGKADFDSQDRTLRDMQGVAAGPGDTLAQKA